MITNCANFPPFREELKKMFGYLSFQTALINLDVIGVRIVADKGFKGEVVTVFFRSSEKVGFAYEGEQLSKRQAFEVFMQIPENFNLIADYEKEFEGKTEILKPRKDNYVFINDKEVEKINLKK